MIDFDDQNAVMLGKLSTKIKVVLTKDELFVLAKHVRGFLRVFTTNEPGLKVIYYHLLQIHNRYMRTIMRTDKKIRLSLNYAEAYIFYTWLLSYEDLALRDTVYDKHLFLKIIGEINKQLL
ncbi:MAG: hypothetical protein PHU33_16015 [Bacteroidales bacterium]|nr:hypothetical protein [Bacteroidales bacterium]